MTPEHSIGQTDPNNHRDFLQIPNQNNPPASGKIRWTNSNAKSD